MGTPAVVLITLKDLLIRARFATTGTLGGKEGHTVGQPAAEGLKGKPMRYRRVHAVAIATLLALPFASAVRATERPARALRGASGAPTAAAATAAPSWLGVLRALWLGDEHPGNSGHGTLPNGHPFPDPPPEGSGLCPHGQH